MKQVTAILLGAGQRGAQAYASYALAHPDELKFVAVAEPREDRREEFRKAHNIPMEDAVATDMELLERPRMADCVMICTQDQMHYRALKKAAERGYHILCEKPISPDRRELEEIRAEVQDEGFLDLRALRQLELLTDRAYVESLICRDLPKTPITFRDYPRNPRWLLNLRELVAAEIEAHSK